MAPYGFSTAGTTTVFDVFSVSGQALHASPGDFSSGVCVQEDLGRAAFDHVGPDPTVGDALLFMFRAQNSCATATYGTPGRDSTADLSGSPCL